MVDAAPLAIRTILSEPGKAGIDDAWVDGPNRFVVDPETALHGRSPVLDDDVSGGQQLVEQRPSGFGLEIEGEAALVAMQVLKVGTVAGSAQFVVAALGRRLDADHIGAPIRKLADRGRTGARHRQIEHTDVIQRQHARQRSAVARPSPSPSHRSSSFM